MAWTDERLDDLARRTDVGFDHLRTDIRDLRQETSALRTEMGALRTEMHEGFGELRSDVSEQIRELRTMVVRVGGGLIVGFAGVIATVAVGGI